MDRSDTDDASARMPWGFLLFALLASCALAWGLSTNLRPRDVGLRLTPEATPAERLAVQEAVFAARARLVAALAPVFALLVALFYPPLPAALRALGHRRVALVAAGLAAWVFVVSTVPATRFDPYFTVLIALWAAVPLLAQRLDPEPGRLTSVVLVAWLAWWIPFDLRWYDTSLHMRYDAASLLVSLLAVLAFGVFTRAGAPSLELRPPTPTAIGVGVLTLVAFGAIAIPLGLGLDFLHPRWPPKTDAAATVVKGFVIAVTIALPEELYFRGVLDAGLRPYFRRAWTSLAVSSVAFGLMHWNNRPKLEDQLEYLLLATVAGLFYGAAYRTGGLWAAVTAHTLVDLIWDTVLR